ncbi:PucR family transcriptional regulator [Nesterenkonia muleiensis]|uniref:PucR family transcriptional regulator n=1 Tax=Nesterenkonia muleiensis TaxID=2282648 RepID=UPI00138FC603|nr:helix-turn-helix domain-containing protein [Nesterenkonia muleiensis]
MDAITDLAEQLAQEIKRSVAVDDADLRLLGYSTHFEDADPLRLSSLANRRIEGPVREATFAAGFLQWREPRRGKALGIEGHEYDRMAFPLRSRYGLLGVMWLILTDERDLTEAEMKKCLAVAHQMERLLDRQAQADLDTDREVETLLFTLLSDDAADRETALRDLADLGYFEASTHITVLAVSIEQPPAARPTEEIAAVLRRGLKQATGGRAGRRSMAFAVTENRGFLLIGSRGVTAGAELSKVAERARHELSRLDPGLKHRIRCGIGSTLELGQVSRSYDHAQTAAKIAAEKDLPLAHWSDHPLEALLATVIAPTVDPAGLPPVLSEDVGSVPEETLHTVACFLDQAGNAARTSELLHLHRTTVYYRLRQFEKETGLSLDSGRDRLLLQLWLAIRDRR